MQSHSDVRRDSNKRDDFDAINERLCEGEATEWNSVELHPHPI